MRPVRRLAMVASLLVAVLISPSAGKNLGVGIYVVIDKVTFEPDEKMPERVRIAGVFAVPVPMSSGSYRPPERGYLYFRTPPDRGASAKKEWAALASVAGTGEVVGFTLFYVPDPHDAWGNPHHALEVVVHRKGEEAAPVDYPLPFDRGLVRDGDPAFDTAIAKELASAVYIRAAGSRP